MDPRVSKITTPRINTRGSHSDNKTKDTSQVITIKPAIVPNENTTKYILTYVLNKFLSSNTRNMNSYLLNGDPTGVPRTMPIETTSGDPICALNTTPNNMSSLKPVKLQIIQPRTHSCTSTRSYPGSDPDALKRGGKEPESEIPSSE